MKSSVSGAVPAGGVGNLYIVRGLAVRLRPLDKSLVAQIDLPLDGIQDDILRHRLAKLRDRMKTRSESRPVLNSWLRRIAPVIRHAWRGLWQATAIRCLNLENKMDASLESLESEALKLGPAEKAHLLERLVASLDVDREIEEAWEKEADRREAELESGAATAIPGEEAVVRLRARISL